MVDCSVRREIAKVKSFLKPTQIRYQCALKIISWRLRWKMYQHTTWNQRWIRVLLFC